MRHSDSRSLLDSPCMTRLLVNSSDHIEGEALVAERNAHAYDDGVLSKEEKKALDAAHKKQLHNRHRGVYQFRPYRTAIWMKEGLVRRFTATSSSGRRERKWITSTPYVIVVSHHASCSHCQIRDWEINSGSLHKTINGCATSIDLDVVCCMSPSLYLPFCSFGRSQLCTLLPLLSK